MSKNYDKEAEALIKDLPSNQLYDLYEIVLNKLQKRNSPQRDLELKAVKKAIEGVRRLDKPRLQKMRTGYSSSMANTARAKDGNTKPNRKKV